MQVDTISNFEWQRQLRYYWDLDQDTCLATMALATYVYGYEYLGACPRLVITPLTVSARLTCCPNTLSYYLTHAKASFTHRH